MRLVETEDFPETENHILRRKILRLYKKKGDPFEIAFFNC